MRDTSKDIQHVESKPIIKEGVKIHGKPVTEPHVKIVGGGGHKGEIEIKDKHGN